MLEDERTFIENFIAPNRRERTLSKGIAHLQYAYDIERHVDASKCFPLARAKWAVIANWLTGQTSFGIGRVAFGLNTTIAEVDLSDFERLWELCAFEGLVLFRGGRVALLCSEPGVDRLLFADRPEELRRLYDSYERFRQQHRR